MMGVSGISPSLGGIQPKNNLSPVTNPATARYAGNPGFQSVLQGLGIRTQDVSAIVRQQGGQAKIQDGIRDVQLIHTTAEQKMVLEALGLSGVALAVVVQSEEEISRIRKRMKDVKESMFDKKKLAQMGQSLGVPVSENSLVFSDTQGGLFIIQAGIREIVQSKSDEDSEE